MAKIEASVMIDCPVEEVWKYISDLTNMPRWSPDVVEAKQTSSGSLGIGATLQVKHPDRTLSGIVVEYVPDRQFTFELTSGPPRGTKVSLELEDKQGKTVLTQAFDFRLGGFYRLLGPFVSGSTKRKGAEEARANVARVKQFLESRKQTQAQL